MNGNLLVKNHNFWEVSNVMEFRNSINIVYGLRSSSKAETCEILFVTHIKFNV